MYENISVEVANLHQFAASTRHKASLIEQLAVTEGMYDDMTKEHVARQREDADITDAVAAWGRQHGF